MKYETNLHVLQNLRAAVDSLSNSSFLCVLSRGTEWTFKNTNDQHLSHRIVEVCHVPYNTLFAANNGRYAIAVPDSSLETPDVPVLRSGLVHEWVPEWPVVGGINGPYVYPWSAESCMRSLAACMCRVEGSNETFPAIVAKLRTFECGTAVSIGEDAFVVPLGSNMIALFHGPLVQWKS